MGRTLLSDAFDFDLGSARRPNKTCDVTWKSGASAPRINVQIIEGFSPVVALFSLPQQVHRHGKARRSRALHPRRFTNYKIF